MATISQKLPEKPGRHRQEACEARPSSSTQVPPCWQGELRHGGRAEVARGWARTACRGQGAGERVTPAAVTPAREGPLAG